MPPSSRPWCVASMIWPNGTTAPLGSRSILSRPPDISSIFWIRSTPIWWKTSVLPKALCHFQVMTWPWVAGAATGAAADEAAFSAGLAAAAGCAAAVGAPAAGFASAGLAATASVGLAAASMAGLAAGASDLEAAGGGGEERDAKEEAARNGHVHQRPPYEAPQHAHPARPPFLAFQSDRLDLAPRAVAGFQATVRGAPTVDGRHYRCLPVVVKVVYGVHS